MGTKRRNVPASRMLRRSRFEFHDISLGSSGKIDRSRARSRSRASEGARLLAEGRKYVARKHQRDRPPSPPPPPPMLYTQRIDVAHGGRTSSFSSLKAFLCSTSAPSYTPCALLSEKIEKRKSGKIREDASEREKKRGERERGRERVRD